MPSQKEVEKVFENILNGAATKIVEEEEPEVTKTIGNEIHFYGEITPENTLEFVESFRKLETSLLKQKADLIGYEPEIRIHIMSEGGDMFSGFTLKNVIEKSVSRLSPSPKVPAALRPLSCSWVDQNVAWVRMRTF